MVPEDMWDKLETTNFHETIRRMKEIDDNTENERCVFFFDN